VNVAIKISPSGVWLPIDIAKLYDDDAETSFVGDQSAGADVVLAEDGHLYREPPPSWPSRLSV
jgi:hypothetical protein